MALNTGMLPRAAGCDAAARGHCHVFEQAAVGNVVLFVSGGAPQIQQRVVRAHVDVRPQEEQQQAPRQCLQRHAGCFQVVVAQVAVESKV